MIPSQVGLPRVKNYLQSCWLCSFIIVFRISYNYYLTVSLVLSSENMSFYKFWKNYKLINLQPTTDNFISLQSLANVPIDSCNRILPFVFASRSRQRQETTPARAQRPCTQHPGGKDNGESEAGDDHHPGAQNITRSNSTSWDGRSHDHNLHALPIIDRREACDHGEAGFMLYLNLVHVILAFFLLFIHSAPTTDYNIQLTSTSVFSLS
jgi:hypothetical protein